MIDVTKKFKDAATIAEYEFAYGRKDIQNWEATRSVSLSAGEIVLLVFPFIETAEIDNSIIHKWSVSTQLWLGKKFETEVIEEIIVQTTYAQLDETELQKYDRRLQTLRSNMETLIKTIFCNDPELELTNARIFREINQFDENLDFVTCEITFLYDS